MDCRPLSQLRTGRIGYMNKLDDFRFETVLDTEFNEITVWIVAILDLVVQFQSF